MNPNPKKGFTAIVGRDIRLMNSLPLLWISFVVISMVPSFYALTYLGSLWDPYSRLSELPVALVNMDVGTRFRDEDHRLGDRLIEELDRKQSFNFLEYQTRDSALASLTAGETYFALIVPKDFSGKAIPGLEKAEVELITSSGTSYTAALMGQKFVEVAVENLNYHIEAKRWEVVLDSGTTASDAARRLANGSDRALAGASTLHEGLEKLTRGTQDLEAGQDQLAQGLGAIDTQRLVAAGAELHGGTQKLAEGLARHKMLDKLAGLDTDLLTQLADGASQYQEKIEELSTGLEKASSGAAALRDGTSRLLEGMDTARDGSEALRDGIQQLNTGLNQFAAAFPSIRQNVDDMALSVTSKHTALNDASVNGLGFAPFLIAFALWIGAMSASFVFLVATFSELQRGSGVLSRLLGKEVMPALMCVLGALLLGLMIHWRAGNLADTVGFYTLLAFTGLTYNSITLVLIRALGDSGKLLALLFLVVQLASAGGAYPIELSPPFYQTIAPYMPMTAVVDGLRAAMFGSFNGDWMSPALRLLPWLLGSWTLGLLALSRSQYTTDSAYGPALRLLSRKPG